MLAAEPVIFGVSPAFLTPPAFFTAAFLAAPFLAAARFGVADFLTAAFLTAAFLGAAAFFGAAFLAPPVRPPRADFGGADASLMRLVDILHAIPRFFLFVICAALFGPSALLLVIVLGATGWTGIARLTRGQALSIRHRSFVEAARALGGNARSIVIRHLLPQCAAPVMVAAALMAADTILAEASLSFLGIGIQPPAASWGNIIAGGRDSLLTAWWITAFPGLAIMATVLLLHAAGRGLIAPGSAGGAHPALLD